MTAAAGVEPAVTGQRVLYEDDFTDPGSGWPDNLEFGNSYVGYHEPDYYHVEVHAPHDRAVVAVPERTFDDFTVEVQAFIDSNNTAETGDFRNGVVFRRTGNQYYAFTVSPRTKTWYVLKVSPTGVTELKKGSSDAIQGLTATDALHVDAKGATFFFAINGEAVGQVSDTDYASGQIGFYVETFDSPRVHVHHDTITIRQVEAPQLLCTVLAPALNFREGPDMAFRIISVLSRGAHVEPQARSANGYWIRVRVEGTDQVGWISRSPQRVACNIPANDLPLPPR